MEHQFTINIWEHILTDNINEILDDSLYTDNKLLLATDITYQCLEITKEGKLVIQAEFTPDESS